MIKLVCVKCHKAWYTANTAWKGNCECCGGNLEEADNILCEKEINTDAEELVTKNQV